MTITDPVTGVLEDAWELDPAVALRPEPFGALAYNFHTRQLTFLKTPELAAVVGRLADSTDLREALIAAGVPDAQWEAYAGAVRSLASTGMVRRRQEPLA